jgi:hypothetical protein
MALDGARRDTVARDASRSNDARITLKTGVARALATSSDAADVALAEVASDGASPFRKGGEAKGTGAGAGADTSRSRPAISAFEAVVACAGARACGAVDFTMDAA